uniref:Guanylate cyclase n=1 Tax=Sphaeramia orbicularis TaxID=375764 RepID=A0A673AB87_9TELE
MVFWQTQCVYLFAFFLSFFLSFKISNKGANFSVDPTFNGFKTDIYRHRGCWSSTCEGVEELINLTQSAMLGYAVLGPTCTYATFQIVDLEKGLRLSTPLLSAGSFGLSCDNTTNLQRLLPPAHKISEFLIKFWKDKNTLKSAWETTYVYKKPINSEDCFWYINALDSDSGQFISEIQRKVLRKPQDLQDVLSSPTNRTSNRNTLKITSLASCHYSDKYYTNTSSMPFMQNVLVVTMPNTRNYTISTNLTDGNMVRVSDRWIFQKNHLKCGEFRTSIYKLHFQRRIAGNYRLDEHGDRDVTLSILYTTTDNKYQTLFKFNTQSQRTELIETAPSFVWGKRLIDDTPSIALQDIIVVVLAVTVVVVATIAFIFYRWVYKTMFCKIVILKELNYSDGIFSETQKIELNALLQIDYYNLTKFYGTVKFDQGVFGVFEYGERGSLRYVRNNKVSYPEETFMDWEFKISVMYDIAKGMTYLHASDIQVHGRLKSTNCVVDNRMVVKITDFGCNPFLSPGRDLWIAPEHLRKQGTSQKGDVYSFAIIAQEIVLRKCTFYTESCSDREEKLSRVQNVPYFRPDLNYDHSFTHRIRGTSCWEEEPEKRPDFKKVENCLEKSISKIHNHDNESYMDNMIRRLQMYSRNLEHLVEERTVLYKAERDRADCLNFMLLPGPVVKSLKESGVVEPELYDEVTIYFSDIVGFTTLCQYSTPMEVVDMLNDIYKGFDSIVDHHDVYKVETIGDAYMVHAVDICHMLRHLPGIPVWIRPCAAGVVGLKMPRYCLFGDTVNTASRMESTGHPLRIHVSQPTINILKRTDCKFVYEYRGETYLKGKGAEMTYWLTGETDEDYNLPTPPTAENFQRLQQDLAHMILECLDQRSQGSVTQKKRLLSQTKEGDQVPETELESESEHPEYLHLAFVDNTLSTFL